MENNPWVIFQYEVQMYWAMTITRSEIGKGKGWSIVIEPQSTAKRIPWLIQGKRIRSETLTMAMNAFIESKLLHVRILAEILLERGTEPDDIKLIQLVPNWKVDQDLVKSLGELRTIYGNAKTENTPCWTINKMLAHFTSFRLSSFNYQTLFETIDPPLKSCVKRIAEIYPDQVIVALMNSIM